VFVSVISSYKVIAGIIPLPPETSIIAVMFTFVLVGIDALKTRSLICVVRIERICVARIERWAASVLRGWNELLFLVPAPFLEITFTIDDNM